MSEKIDDGGPFHPVEMQVADASGAVCGNIVVNQGATLLDYFAGQALSGQCASLSTDARADAHRTVALSYGMRESTLTAKICYAIANAMIAERNRLMATEKPDNAVAKAGADAAKWANEAKELLARCAASLRRAAAF